MKFLVLILLLLTMAQSFARWSEVLSFTMNQSMIENKLCEKRNQPIQTCKGKCALVKKMKNEEKKEQNNPGSLKIEYSHTVLSSKSFFATLEIPGFSVSSGYTNARDTGEPTDRPSTFFHPPAA